MTNYQLSLLTRAVEGDLYPSSVPSERQEDLDVLINDGHLDKNARVTDLGLRTYRYYTDGEE